MGFWCLLQEVIPYPLLSYVRIAAAESSSGFNCWCSPASLVVSRKTPMISIGDGQLINPDRPVVGVDRATVNKDFRHFSGGMT